MATTKLPVCPDCKQPIRPAGWSEFNRTWECGYVHPAEVAGIRTPHGGITQHDDPFRRISIRT
jgi:hypothetical protein